MSQSTAIRQKLSGNCVFPHNFHTRKLGKITVFFAVETLDMFSKQERRKSKYKFAGTKVCKAEEVRKCFVNPKIENGVFG